MTVRRASNICETCPHRFCTFRIPDIPTTNEPMSDIDLDRVAVTHNEAEGQFEAAVDGKTAFTEYTLARGVMVFTHTEVPPALEGQGVAGKLVRTALEHARAEGLTVWPVCPFVRRYIRRHLEFRDLVATRARDGRDA